jgi:hypothetical protein
MSSQPIQSTEPGYVAAVAEEARSHDDISLHGTLTTAYRQLVSDCLLMAPDLSGFTSVTELEAECDLSPEDLALIRAVKGSQDSTVTDLHRALLADIQAEWELQNERKAQARDEDFYGSSSPQTERESLESYYGMGRLFK